MTELMWSPVCLHNTYGGQDEYVNWRNSCSQRERDGNTEVDNLLEGHDCAQIHVPSTALLFEILKIFELPFCPDIAETEHFLLVHPKYGPA